MSHSARQMTARFACLACPPTAVVLAARGQKAYVAHWVSAGRTVAEIATRRTVIVPQLTTIGAIDPTSTVPSISAGPRTALLA